MKFGKVLAVVTGKHSDPGVISHAASLVREQRGSLIIVYVIRVDRSLPLDAEVPDEIKRGEEILQSAEAALSVPRMDVEAELVQSRELGSAVVHEAAVRNVDAVVLGTPYPTDLGRFSLGTDIPYVLEYAPCYVFLLREPVGGAPTGQRQLTGRAATR